MGNRLDDLVADFAAWRESKKPGERVPVQLWERAEMLCEAYPTSIVAKRLAIDFYALRERLRKQAESTALTCSKVIALAEPQSQQIVPVSTQLGNPLCEIAFPNCTLVRFFADCDALRQLLFPRSES